MNGTAPQGLFVTWPAVLGTIAVLTALWAVLSLALIERLRARFVTREEFYTPDGRSKSLTREDFNGFTARYDRDQHEAVEAVKALRAEVARAVERSTEDARRLAVLEAAQKMQSERIEEKMDDLAVQVRGLTDRLDRILEGRKP